MNLLTSLLSLSLVLTPILNLGFATRCRPKMLPPGASGGPLFGRDGRLVGLIVDMLEGQTLEDGRILTSTLHAFMPGQMLVQKLPEIHPQFTFLNRFATEAELKAVINGHEDKWWIPVGKQEVPTST